MKRGIVFVIIQFCCILLLLKITTHLNYSWILFVQTLAITLGFWSLYEMKKTRISIFPELKEGAQLIQSGPYRIIRHPMYLSILFFFFPVLIEQWSFKVGIIYLILLANLIFKLKYEEQILLKQFDAYSKYRERSYRLIPYFY